jgi:hypothetical protein
MICEKMQEVRPRIFVFGEAMVLSSRVGQSNGRRVQPNRLGRLEESVKVTSATRTLMQSSNNTVECAAILFTMSCVMNGSATEGWED